MAGPDKPENDTPENKDDILAENGTAPEKVEAEIVDSSEGDGTPEEVIASETITENQETSQDEGKSDSVMSPGIVLLGLMALVLVGVMLSRGGTDSAGEAVNVASSTAKPEETVTGDDLLAAAGKAEDKAREVIAEGAEAVAQKAEAVAQAVSPDTAETENPPIAAEAPADKAENPVVEEEVLAEAPVEEAAASLSASELAEQRRRAVIERARARLDAKAAKKQAAAAQELALADQEERIAEDSREAAAPVIAEAGSESAIQDEVADAVIKDAAPALEEAVEEAQEAAPQAVAVTQEKLTNELASLKDEVKADVMAAAQAAIDADKEQLNRQEQQIASLEARLDKLQNSGIASAGKQAAVSVALNNLQRQLDAGRPFAGELSTLKDLVPSLRSSGVDNYADEGLPTMSSLRDDYTQVVRKALAATKRDAGDGLGARFSSLFSVRKIGQVEGDNPSAVMARAEDNLEKGKLDLALRELDTLEGAPAEMFSAWMQDARARVSADQLIADVSNRILSELR